MLISDRNIKCRIKKDIGASILVSALMRQLDEFATAEKRAKEEAERYRQELEDNAKEVLNQAKATET